MTFSPFRDEHGAPKDLAEITFADLTQLSDMDEGYVLEFKQSFAASVKRNVSPTSITQNVEYLLDFVLASTMLSNSELVVMFNQAAADRQKLTELPGIGCEQMRCITNAEAGCGLLRCDCALVSFANRFPRDTELCRLMTTKPGGGEPRAAAGGGACIQGHELAV